MSDLRDRVARGAAWLDEKYPDWFHKIDLSILNMADCTQCVLGQVYTGVIPPSEQGQVLAQAIMAVTSGYPDSDEWAQDYRDEVTQGHFGGYQILTDFHELPQDGEWHGFVALADGRDDAESARQYGVLLEAWTQVILSRRLAFHQNDGVRTL